MRGQSEEITRLLNDLGDSDQNQAEVIYPHVYDYLREMAHGQLLQERRGHTLETTALVHEAYLKMVGQDQATFHNRSHFLAIAALAMRRILISYARKRHAEKRGGKETPVTFIDGMAARQFDTEELIDLDDALELDHDSRVTRLNEVRETDDELFREIQSLLAADADDSSILDGFAIDSIDISGLLSMDGTRVGPFEIERQIGSGGMGNVYLAKRVEGGFEQTVALKLIKYGMDSEQILRRFESERQILARLQHPNIARLVDGGIKDDGRPWFAMDYVQGEPIDEYCNSKDLDIEKRLELFLTVLSAVQYAHRNLVVHRDLKPHNILVHQDGDSVEIKLLDFGIARLLSEDEEQTALTQEGVRPMTRSYASPEQLKGESVTTASDVYSLGVVLYELLAGRRPFEQKELSTVEFEKLICTSVPPKPSQILSKSTEKGGGRPVKFQKRRLIKQLAGDLDMICLKALRLEPERRYDTADQFAEDIKRHLAERPILARPVSKRYQAQKFVRRNTVGVLATLLILLSLIGGIIAFAWQYRVAALERDRA